LDLDYLVENQRYLWNEAQFGLTAGKFSCQDILRTVKPALIDYA